MRSLVFALCLCLCGCECSGRVEIERRMTGREPRSQPRISVSKWSTEKGRYVETVHEKWPTVTEIRETPKEN